MSIVQNTISSYYGGKWEQYDWIAPHLHEHHIYNEVYGGMAGVLLRKPPSPVEVYNDVNRDLVNLFAVCRDHPEELARAIELTPVSYHEWKTACRSLDAVRRLVDGVLSREGMDDDLTRWATVLRDMEVDPAHRIEAARRMIVKLRQSLAGAPGRGWQCSVHHSRRGMASSCSAWMNMPQAVREVGQRMSRVQLECRPAIHVLLKYDSPQTLHYVDPPYHPDTCKTGVYSAAGGAEMSVAEHAALLRCVRRLRGTVLLAGYDNDLYEKWLMRRSSGWEKVVKEVPCRSAVNTSGSTAQRTTRSEVLWIKRSAEATKSGGGLFD